MMTFQMFFNPSQICAYKNILTADFTALISVFMLTRHLDLHITTNWWEWRKICEKHSRKLSALTFKVYEYLSPSIHFPFTFLLLFCLSFFIHSFIHHQKDSKTKENTKKHDNNDDDDKKWFDTPHKNVTKCVYFSLAFLHSFLIYLFFSSFHFWKHERKHACVYFFRNWAEVKIKKLNFFLWKYLIYASSEIEIFISFYLLGARFKEIWNWG